MKPGYVPALGTPLDAEGNFLADSYRRQIRDQIDAGAVGLLCMGSMGIQAFLRSSICPLVARTAVEAAQGIPVFVGAMDTSIARVRERMREMESLDVAGFVLTAPYYSPASQQQMITFFKGAAKGTAHKVLLYDLPGVTQSKITYEMVLQMLREIPNLAGIKSADLQMFRRLKLNPEVPDDFIMVYSGLDTFDIAYHWGITNCLDGMLSCTPKNSKALFDALAAGDKATAARHLNAIVALRDLFVAHDLWPSYTAAMNVLGYAGSYGPDYTGVLASSETAVIRSALAEMGEIDGEGSL